MRTAERAAQAAGRQLQAARAQLRLASLASRTPHQQARLLSDDAHALARATLARAFAGHTVVGRQEDHPARPDITRGPVWLLDVLDGETAFLAERGGWAVSIALAVDGEVRLGVVHDPVEDVTFRALAGGGAQWERPATGPQVPPAGHDATGAGQAVAAPMPARITATVRPATRVRLSEARMAARFPTPGSPTMVAFSREFGRATQAVPGVHRCAAASLALAHVACGRLDAFWTRDPDPCSTAAGLLVAREAGAVLRARDGLDPLRTRSLAVSAPAIAYDFHALLAGL